MNMSYLSKAYCYICFFTLYVSADVLVDTFFFSQCSHRDGFVDSLTVFEGNGVSIVEGQFRPVGGLNMFNFPDLSYSFEHPDRVFFSSYPGVVTQKDAVIEGVVLPVSFLNSNFAIIFFSDLYYQEDDYGSDIHEDKIIEILNIGDKIIVSEVFVTHPFENELYIFFEVNGYKYRLRHQGYVQYIPIVDTYVLYKMDGSNGRKELVLCARVVFGHSDSEIICTCFSSSVFLEPLQVSLLDTRNASKFVHEFYGVQEGEILGRRMLTSTSFITFENEDIPFAIDFEDEYSLSYGASFILNNFVDVHDYTEAGLAFSQEKELIPSFHSTPQTLALSDFTYAYSGYEIILATNNEAVIISRTEENEILLEAEEEAEFNFEFSIDIKSTGCTTHTVYAARFDLKPTLPYFTSDEINVTALPNQRTLITVEVRDSDFFNGVVMHPKVFLDSNANLSYGNLKEVETFEPGRVVYSYDAFLDIPKDIEVVDEFNLFLSDDVLTNLSKACIKIINGFYEFSPTYFPTKSPTLFPTDSPTKFPFEIPIQKRLSEVSLYLEIGGIITVASLFIVALTCLTIQVRCVMKGKIGLAEKVPKKESEERIVKVV